MCGGCRRSAGTSPPPWPAAPPWSPASTAPASSTESSNTHRRNTFADQESVTSHPHSDFHIYSSKRCSPPPETRSTPATSRWSPCSDYASSKPAKPISPTSVRNTATGYYAWPAKAARSCWCLYRRRSAARSTGPAGTGSTIRSCSTPAVGGWTGTAPPAAYGCWHGWRWCVCRGCTRTCCGTPSSPPCSMPATARCSDRGPPRRPTHDDALRPRPHEPRPPPQLHPRRLHGLRHMTNRETCMPMSGREQ